MKSSISQSVGLVALALVLLFPSFRHTLDVGVNGLKVQREQSAGISFLLAPPDPLQGAWSVSIDWQRTGITLLAVGAIILAIGVHGSPTVHFHVLSESGDIPPVEISCQEADRLISLPKAKGYFYVNEINKSGRREITLVVSS